MRNVRFFCLAGGVIATLAVAWLSPDQLGLHRGMMLGSVFGGGAGAACLLLGAWGGRIAGNVLGGSPTGPPWGEGVWATALGTAAVGLLLGGALGWVTTPGRAEAADCPAASVESHCTEWP